MVVGRSHRRIHPIMSVPKNNVIDSNCSCIHILDFQLDWLESRLFKEERSEDLTGSHNRRGELFLRGLKKIGGKADISVIIGARK